MKKLIFIALILSVLFANAQIQDSTAPLFLSLKQNLKINFEYTITNFNPQKLIDQDKSDKLIKPYGFAKDYAININFSNLQFSTIDSEKIYILQINAPKSYGLAFRFNNFNTFQNDKIYLISKNKKFYTGGISPMLNNIVKLPTIFVPYDTVLIEYHTSVKNKILGLSIDHVAAAYRPLISSQPCEIDINCDSSKLWQKVKNGVVRYTFVDEFNGIMYTCTGTLIANTNLDETPYFLTANHCVNSESEVESMVFYFNDENLTCNGSPSSTQNTLSTAYLISTADSHLDFTLVKLSTVPPIDYNPYYAGWNRTNKYADTATCIHHPDGDVKKISKIIKPLKVGSFPGYDSKTHWNVVEYASGSTEGGSSGAGLFNTKGQLIGTLTGGSASCNYNFDDYFEQFYHDWKDYPLYSQQLQHWLDPYGFEPFSMNGYYPYENIDLPIPQNLTANLFLDSTVEVSWSAPDSVPDSYKLYRNLEVVDTFSSPQIFIDSLKRTNVYVYYVTAVYANKESKPSNMKSLVFGDTTFKPILRVLTLYPQPAVNILNIMGEQSLIITKVQIMDCLGKVFFTEIVDNFNYTTIDISDLPIGVYIANIYASNFKYTKKFVKVKSY